MSIVEVSAPDFVPNKLCDQFLDGVFEYIFQRFDTSLAPLEFCKEAHIKMIQVFVKELRAEARTFKSVVHETSACQNVYTVYASLAVASASCNLASDTDTSALADARFGKRSRPSPPCPPCSTVQVRQEEQE